MSIRITPLQREILQAIHRRIRITVPGLEDRCDRWKTPRQLYRELGELIVYGLVDRRTDVADMVTYGLTPVGSEQLRAVMS